MTAAVFSRWSGWLLASTFLWAWVNTSFSQLDAPFVFMPLIQHLIDCVVWILKAAVTETEHIPLWGWENYCRASSTPRLCFTLQKTSNGQERESNELQRKLQESLRFVSPWKWGNKSSVWPFERKRGYTLWKNRDSSQMMKWIYWSNA